tara:strand:- start:16431 stop:16655 length:225 start_codon:yes stop_codon:yes gene_type:complete
MSVEMVSRCCGQDWEETENEVYGENGRKSNTVYIIGIVCIACGDWCDIVEDHEYRQWRLDERAEADAEDKKLGL